MPVQSIITKKGFLLGLFTYFLFVSYVTGATYYVGANGSDSNPGTLAKPWANPQKCADVMVGGDTCEVADGVYSDHDGDTHVINIDRPFDGADSNNWVTFKSSNKHGAVLDGKNRTAFGRGFMLDNTAYLKILGFEVKRVYAGIRIMNNSHDISMEDLEIHEIGRHWTDTSCASTAERSYAGINSRADTYNMTVRNCTFYDIGRLHNVPEGVCRQDFKYDHSIYAGGTGWLIENCDFRTAFSGYHVKVDGHDIFTKEPTHVIRNCKFYEGNNSHIYFEDIFGAILVHRSHGKYSPHSIIVESNYFYLPDKGIVIDNNVDMNKSILVQNLTTGSILYSGGSGDPVAVSNTLNIDPNVAFESLDPSPNNPVPTSPRNLKIINKQ